MAWLNSITLFHATPCPAYKPTVQTLKPRAPPDKQIQIWKTLRDQPFANKWALCHLPHNTKSALSISHARTGIASFHQLAATFPSITICLIKQPAPHDSVIWASTASNGSNGSKVWAFQNAKNKLPFPLETSAHLLRRKVATFSMRTAGPQLSARQLDFAWYLHLTRVPKVLRSVRAVWVKMKFVNQRQT